MAGGLPTFHVPGPMKGMVMANTCPVHDEVVGNVKERLTKVEKKLDKVRIAQAKWGGVLAFLLVAIPLALKYLAP